MSMHFPFIPLFKSEDKYFQVKRIWVENVGIVCEEPSLNMR